MPSPISIKVRCQPHLVQFMTTLYGSQPIIFPRKDNFSLLLNYLVEKEPENYCAYDAGDQCLEIQLPYFEDKNVLYNFILTPRKEQIFVNKIEDKFKITFRDEVNQCRLVGLTRIEAIHLFIDKYNLDEGCLDMLLKDYQRYLKLKWHHSRKSKNNSSVKRPVCPSVGNH